MDWHNSTMFSPHLIFLTLSTAAPEISTLSLHDALPICPTPGRPTGPRPPPAGRQQEVRRCARGKCRRSEEHTSELQSRGHVVCRLLLEKKKTKNCRKLAAEHPLQDIRDGYNYTKRTDSQ